MPKPSSCYRVYVVLRRYLPLLGLLVLGARPAAAQSEAEEYRYALQGLSLLKNTSLSGGDAQLLPLGELTDLRPYCVTVGLGGNLFHQTLNHYLPTPLLLVRPDGSRGLNTLPPSAEEVNLLILGVDARAVGSLEPVLAAIGEKSLAGSRLILVVFGPGQLWEQLDASRFDAIIAAGDDSYWSQSLAAQLIYGAVQEAGGRLSLDLSAEFPAGSGLAIPYLDRLGYAPPALAGMDSTLLADSIRAIVEEGIAAGAFPGAQVLVAKDGKVVYHEAFGYHTYDRNRPLHREDIYDLASVTKVSAAVPTFMKLYDEGKISLDEPWASYVPELGGSDKARLTYRDILTHQSRLLAWIPFWRGTLRGNSRYPWQKKWSNSRLNDYRFRSRTFRRDSSDRYPVYVADDLWLHRRYQEKMLKAIRLSPLNAQPGYVYSDLSFYFLPGIVEQQTGLSLPDFLQQNFYAPLGANTITFNPLERFPIDRLVPTEHDTFFRMTQLHGRVHDEGASMMGGISGHAGLFANADDLAKLWQMYLNDGVYGGRLYVAPLTIREFARCQFCEQGNRRGIGFDKPLIEYEAGKSHVARAASPNSFGHSGYTGTFVWADPDANLLYIFLSNRVYPTRDNPLISQLDIRPRIHAALYQAIVPPASMR